jgi:hypothetical protein
VASDAAMTTMCPSSSFWSSRISAPALWAGRRVHGSPKPPRPHRARTGGLAHEPLSSQLIVEQVYDHQGDAGQGSTPILVFDAWEHAFYLHYKNVMLRRLTRVSAPTWRDPPAWRPTHPTGGSIGADR